MPREAGGGLVQDHWLPLGSGFGHGLPVVLSHVVFAGVDGGGDVLLDSGVLVL